MLALDAPSGSAQICTVRGAEPTGLRARQCLEGALAGVVPAELGLPPGALLIVQRVTPAARLRVDRATNSVAFEGAVRTELERCVRSAQRPWLRPVSGAANAVLFVDELELIACLVRDWLRGGLIECWWWPVVLRGLSAPQWWQRRVLVRGDVLPALLLRLAEQRYAVPWISRLSDVEVARVIGIDHRGACADIDP